MNNIIHSEKEIILNAVCENIRNSLPKKEAELCVTFTRDFFGTMSLSDIKFWSVEDLFGASINLWSMIYKNKSNQLKIKIYNPDFEKYGWYSSHTVIEVLNQDMPFLVESIRMAINRMGINLYLSVHMGGMRVVRNEKGEISEIISKRSHKDQNYQIEAPIFFLIGRQTNPKIMEELQQEIQRVIHDNQLIVQDWMPMRKKVLESAEELKKYPKVCNKEEVHESQEFLKWIEHHHFTFMGIRDYDLVQNSSGEYIIRPIKGTGLGILGEGRPEVTTINLSRLPQSAIELCFSHQVLIIAKTEIKSVVHRDAYLDYIGIKRFNANGEVIGERRIYGLFTSAVYFTYIRDIPLLRQKVQNILNMSELDPRSHAGRVLINILETMPRDDLIQGSVEELLQITQGIRYLQDRKQTQLFVRNDVYNRFLSCLVYIPKEIYNTSFRQSIENIFGKHLEALSIDFSTMFTESVLARIHFMIHLKKGAQRPSDEVIANIEHELVHAGRTWLDDLSLHLNEAYGEEQGSQLYERYQNAFNSNYTDNVATRFAVIDIYYLENLYKSKHMMVQFSKSLDDEQGHFRIKLFQLKNTIALSDVLPIIENFGLRATVERPYNVKPFEREEASWINEFLIQYPFNKELELEEVKDNFQESFLKIWLGEIENDKFNKLILAANLNYRHVVMLRAYARYLKQLGIQYSQDYIELALLHQADIARKLTQLFDSRFEPSFIGDREKNTYDIQQSLLHDLELVTNLDEDKIIRMYIDLILNTLRTNFYQKDKHGCYKTYVSFKFESKNIPRMPKPYPKYEIFVYSPRFEAIHLRCSDVSRGGLRWSDRKEDFRTEVLGLMKAQQVKNSVIVPNGAKGGFVPKLLDNFTNRDEYQAEAVACYQDFIRGLLDITDNYQSGEIVHPASVVSYDPPDPYLVVAADKGTASFSDYANAIANEYKFWLGDAFASGGSNGYDHKKMGITARGAWESVKRHFYYLGKDIQTTAFTAVGIGDMAGDVFGNGMLLSKHIRLVAAFNHQHIFIDPNPEETLSYAERERLFQLPRSTWMDYNPELISKGGGVFNRSAKFIDISQEVKDRFLINEDRLEPNELIKAILRAPVELLWSAGIGTFVKANHESNTSVGDRTNDLIRLDASELNCQVVGEGGNLGFTQSARVEYALAGGRIYTDFIDNSGGVSCSDKEVNIKILLEILVKNGDLTAKQREELLVDMTQDVSKLVLTENELQTKAISLWAEQSKRNIDLHMRYIRHLEKIGRLDRSIEFLPSDQLLLERKQLHQGLTIPEISVLYCYAKILLKEDILKSNLPEDTFFNTYLIKYFPPQLRESYVKEMSEHPLKREILATTISNLIVNEMGFLFIYRMHDETGAPISVIVSAFMVCRAILKMDEVWSGLQTLQRTVDADFMDSIVMLYVRLGRRMTRWLLCSQRRRLDIQATIDKYQNSFQTFQVSLQDPLNESSLIYYEHQLEDLLARGFSPIGAQNILKLYNMFALFDIIEVSRAKNISLETAASAYFTVGNFLDLEFIRHHVINHQSQDHWEFLAKESVRDELDRQQRQLTETVLVDGDSLEQFEKRLQDWSLQHHALIERWTELLAQLKTMSQINFTMYYVAMRELLDLTQTALQHCADGEICEFF